ncbi:MAG: M28 family peptidase [Promethearchaeota archaeon]
MLQFKAINWGKLYETSNLIVECDPIQKSNRNLVIMAHWDSISHKLSPLLEGIANCIGFFGSLVFSIQVFFFFLFALFSLIFNGNTIFAGINSIVFPWKYFIWIFFLLPIAFLLLFNKIGNDSPGYIDNGSGIGQLLYQVISVSKKPLKTLKLYLIAMRAEELGDFIAFKFIEENSERFGLNPRNTDFLIIDSVGAKNSKNLILTGSGWPVKYWNPRLTQIAYIVLKENFENEIKAKSNKNLSSIPLKFQNIPPLLKISTDHKPIEKFGFQFIVFATKSFIFHSKKDTKEKIEYKNYNFILEFIDKFIRRIDSELARK